MSIQPTEKLVERLEAAIEVTPRPDVGPGYVEVRIDGGKSVLVLTSPRAFATRSAP